MTLIIGAGPAGLATSRELARAGVDHVVLERGRQAGQTWADLYDSLVLHTARELSALPGLPFPRGTPLLPDREQCLSQYLGAVRGDVPASGPHQHRGRHASARRRPVARANRHGRDVFSPGPPSSPPASLRIHASPDIPYRHRFDGRVLHSVEYRRPDTLARAAGARRRVRAIQPARSPSSSPRPAPPSPSPSALAERRCHASWLGVPIQYLSVAVGYLPKAVQRTAASHPQPDSIESSHGPSVLPPPPPAVCPRVPLIGFHLVDAIRDGAIRLKGELEGVHIAWHEVR